MARTIIIDKISIACLDVYVAKGRLIQKDLVGIDIWITLNFNLINCIIHNLQNLEDNNTRLCSPP